MNSQQEKSSWENDPVWDLLDRAKTAEIDPQFVQNVMREVRLVSEPKRLWWKRKAILGPVLAGSMASLVVALVLTFSGDKPSSEIAGVDPMPFQRKSTDLTSTPFLTKKCFRRQLRILPLSVTKY